LNLKLQLNRVGSWGMTVILDLNSFKGTLAMSRPSILMEPDKSSTILLRVKPIDVFPAPVLPTIPIFYPDWMSNDKFLRTVSVYGLYLRQTLLNWTTPLSGHSCLSSKIARSSLSSSRVSFSCTMLHKFMHLSALIILDSI